MVAPKTCDLQVVASCTFLHVAVEHPSLRSGERYFLSGPDQAAVFRLLLFSGFRRPRSHPLTRCLQDISDTKVNHWILPANEPANYFPAAFRVKKLTPALPGRAKVIFSKIIVRTLVVPVYRVVFQKVCLDRSLQIPQICKYSDSCFQIHTPRRVDLIFVL